MRIGFDFDNTIVSYDPLFYNVAVEQSLVPVGLPKSKLAVRDYLRQSDHENVWTELQGYVYGARTNEATAYPGVIDFMRLARDSGISMVIVSHKTRHPFLGPEYDLHEAARSWVSIALTDGTDHLIEPKQVFFELTVEDKIARIAEIQCDYFIDDLPEILLMSGFPENTGRMLFDPEARYGTGGNVTRFGSWQEIRAFFELKWKAHS
ncbi:MAG TPA: haloacid dehalogenase-like hydrolase [Gammaproteobacteria bacterium]|nr:haloacid dehalogenase-like hydrolase [Gammaproteobacteria bacterium]